MDSLGFFIDQILPAAPWPWGREKRVQRNLLRGKGGRFLGLTTLPPSCADRLEILGASTSWNPQGLYRNFFIFCFTPWKGNHLGFWCFTHTQRL